MTYLIDYLNQLSCTTIVWRLAILHHVFFIVGRQFKSPFAHPGKRARKSGSGELESRRRLFPRCDFLRRITRLSSRESITLSYIRGLYISITRFWHTILACNNIGAHLFAADFQNKNSLIWNEDCVRPLLFTIFIRYFPYGSIG